MLARGDLAPEFEGETATGERIAISRLRGHPVVLYFFPKAGSPGCTRESKELAGRYSRFRERGIEVIGISVDDLARQREFRDRCDLPFPLVADADREISRKYGVLGAFGLARRVTFVLDAEGRVDRVIESILPGPHVREASRLLDDPAGPSPP